MGHYQHGRRLDTALARSYNTEMGQRLEEALTEREEQLLQLILTALPDKDISSRMGIAMPTVRFHVSNVFRKFGVSSRAELIVACLGERQESAGARHPRADKP